VLLLRLLLRSSITYRAVRNRPATSELLERIVAAHKASRGTYGSPRITRALRTAGLRVGRKRIARLMALRGLVGRAKRRRKRTTIADPAASGRATDLLRRDFAPEAHEIDTLWCGDISYVRTWEGWAYVATVIDLASRRVVGLALCDHLRASLASEALTMALTQRRPAPGLVFHSDSEYVVAGSFGWSDPHSDRREKMRKDQLPPAA
jgi:transposase InsO family protein